MQPLDIRYEAKAKAASGPVVSLALRRALQSWEGPWEQLPQEEPDEFRARYIALGLHMPDEGGTGAGTGKWPGSNHRP